MTPAEYLEIDASWTRGARTQKGLLVIRPDYAVFAPTESAVNALAMIGAGLAVASVGFHLHVVPGQYANVASWVSALAQLPAAEYDQHLRAAAAAANWLTATPAESRLLFQKVWLFDRYKCWVRRPDDAFGAVFGIPGAKARLVEPMLVAWPRA